MTKKSACIDLSRRFGILLVLMVAVGFCLLLPPNRALIPRALAQESGDPDPSEYAGGSGDTCEDPNPCGDDACCGDPCCGDPCCGDACCSDPESCGDPCWNDPGSCDPVCYDYCLAACGDNETCMPGWEDPETRECYAFESDFCCQYVTYCF